MPPRNARRAATGPQRRRRKKTRLLSRPPNRPHPSTTQRASKNHRRPDPSTASVQPRRSPCHNGRKPEIEPDRLDRGRRRLDSRLPLAHLTLLEQRASAPLGEVAAVAQTIAPDTRPAARMARPRRWTKRAEESMGAIVIGTHATTRRMRKLYTVAFPSLDESDARFIAEIRAQPRPPGDRAGAALHAAVRLRSRRRVELRRPRAGGRRADDGLPFACLETEPDEDEGTRRRLPGARAGPHGRHHAARPLYTGPMAPYLRKDKRFVAHITIGHAANLDAAAERCATSSTSTASTSPAPSTRWWSAASRTAASWSWRASRCATRVRS